MDRPHRGGAEQQRHLMCRAGATKLKKGLSQSATMCDVMMTHVSMKTRLKTQGLFDPSDVCAYRGQTVYCTTEICLSVDKREKDSKRRKERCQCAVFMQCTFCHTLKTENTHKQS